MITPNRQQTVESVRRHYDELDDYYRDLWGEHVHHGLWTSGRETPKEACDQLIRLVADAASIGDGQFVCDVGCGYGGTARFLASVYRARVTGLTVSQAQFQYACEHANGSDNPSYLLRNWEENCFDADRFDAVVSIECLAHVPDKQKYFDEIHRVLKPGGRSAVLAWLADPQPKRWEVRHLLEPICREGRLPGMGSDKEYQQMIEQAGLKLERFEELARQVRKTWWICARRLLAKLCTSPRYMRALFDSSNGNRIFAVTLFRILTAYYSGAMQYGLFVMHKPADPGKAE